MNRPKNLTVILDANVLYPAPLRDYLLSLAELSLFHPKWTDDIQEEWIRNLLLNRTDLKRKDLERARNAMNSAFPDANIVNYQKLITGLSLPDSNDRHVLAAAIKGEAQVIVTVNLKDFPIHMLRGYAIRAQHPDGFISYLIDSDKEGALKALQNQVKRLRNPQLPIDEVLENLERNGLTNSVAKLRN